MRFPIHNLQFATSPRSSHLFIPPLSRLFSSAAEHPPSGASHLRHPLCNPSTYSVDSLSFMLHPTNLLIRSSFSPTLLHIYIYLSLRTLRDDVNFPPRSPLPRFYRDFIYFRFSLDICTFSSRDCQISLRAALPSARDFSRAISSAADHN